MQEAARQRDLSALPREWRVDDDLHHLAPQD
jgi:hypothetical protein